MSVTPLSGAQLTRNVNAVRYVGKGFTCEPGRTVSTIVHVSFAEGPGWRFPARSSAVVANSYTPSAAAVNVNCPKFPPGWVAYAFQPPPPPVRYHKVMFPTPVPFPSDAVYPIANVNVFSYAGNELAAEVGASRSTITNGSVWLVPMFTDRGLFAKL